MINFTRQDLNAVAQIAQRKVADDAGMLRAVERALVNLATGQFSYDGHQVILHSASGAGTYRISCTEPMKCSCKGRARGYRCWHVVASRLIVRAAEYHAQQLDWNIDFSHDGERVYAITAAANAVLFGGV